MDKKLTFTGGEPNINIDDLLRDARAQLGAITDTFKAWLSGSNENFIISGCELTVDAGVDASVAAGYIWLNGEVLKVDAQTTAFATTDTYYFEKLTTYDPEGTKVFKDAQTRQTWQVNRGVLKNSPTDPVPTDKLDARGNTLAGKVLAKIKGDYLEVNAASATVPAQVNYLKLGISGTGTWVLTIPKADDQTLTADVNFIHVYEQLVSSPIGIFEVRDVEGTLVTTFTEPSFSMWVNDNGTWQELVNIPLTEPAPTPPVLIEVELPSWNMKNTPDILVPHGIVNKDLIKTIFCRIIDDAGTVLWDFTSSGSINWDNLNVHLVRDTAGDFDSNDFNGTGFSRGKIYIQL